MFCFRVLAATNISAHGNQIEIQYQYQKQNTNRRAPGPFRYWLRAPTCLWMPASSLSLPSTPVTDIHHLRSSVPHRDTAPRGPPLLANPGGHAQARPTPKTALPEAWSARRPVCTPRPLPGAPLRCVPKPLNQQPRIACRVSEQPTLAVGTTPCRPRSEPAISSTPTGNAGQHSNAFTKAKSLLAPSGRR